MTEIVVRAVEATWGPRRCFRPGVLRFTAAGTILQHLVGHWNGPISRITAQQRLCCLEYRGSVEADFYLIWNLWYSGNGISTVGVCLQC
jgi:hypothetical protein